MTYQETLDFLFTQIPVFQREGATAYKPGLERALALSAAFGDPHRRFASIHIGGTNGKGSSAHTIAAVLQSAGYKVGLYTSPHLVDFRERIRINGEMISEDAVVDFVERFQGMNLPIEPSFFELTMTMAFEYFARERVDIAVVEVGLGGRLDSTNILVPRLSVITNISLDHVALLGDTPTAIATEKAGIIKAGIPAIIGEAEGDVKRVFLETADEVGAPILFAQECRMIKETVAEDGGWRYRGTPFGDIWGALSGDCQPLNAATILTALTALQRQGWEITPEDVAEGFANVETLTGLAGRWMKVSEAPTVICDTGHNAGGWEYLSKRLAALAPRLKMVVGFVNDKDVNHILELMPRKAEYFFARADVPRSLPAEEVARQAREHGLEGETYNTVAEAFATAKERAAANDTIFIGGSNFIVGDFLKTTVK